MYIHQLSILIASTSLLITTGTSVQTWSADVVPDGDNEGRTAAYLARRDWFVEKNAEAAGDYYTLPLSDDETTLNDWFIKARNNYINYHVIQGNDFAPQQVVTTCSVQLSFNILGEYVI
jgi:hypothetical protein